MPSDSVTCSTAQFGQRSLGGQLKEAANEGHLPAGLLAGFTPRKDKPASLDVLPISAGTDPGLALKTRKGTGYYKIPSLKGLWYRGHYLHDGSAASLEELFDPDRLKDTHVPGGWSPPGARTRAIHGHEFGLALSGTEREELIAFLKTL